MMIYPSPIFEEALRLIKEGFSPFPMHISKPIENNTLYLCSCGKLNCRGKHPVVAFSEWKNTTSFGSRWENYGIGIHVGRSHCWVLDVDGDDGFNELQQLLDTHGDLPETRMVKTGSGGRHYYFAAWVDKVCSGFLTTNLHIKGNVGNSYVVAPPSKHYSGNKYEYLLRVPPMDAPEWLLDLVKKNATHTTVSISKEQIDLRHKYEIPILQILSDAQLKNLHAEGNLIRGSHPTHGSTTGRNFTIDKNLNRWFCNRHRSFGGVFELAAILSGICKCEDFIRVENEITIPPLQGKKFKSVVQFCLDIGIDAEDLKCHISRGKYERK